MKGAQSVYDFRGWIQLKVCLGGPQKTWINEAVKEWLVGGIKLVFFLKQGPLHRQGKLNCP